MSVFHIFKIAPKVPNRATHHIHNLNGTRNSTRCNNRDDLLHLSLILKISILSEAYIYNPLEHIWWSFYCKNSKPLSIFTKSSIVDACLSSKYASALWRLFKEHLWTAASNYGNLDNFFEKMYLVEESTTLSRVNLLF